MFQLKLLNNLRLVLGMSSLVVLSGCFESPSVGSSSGSMLDSKQGAPVPQVPVVTPPSVNYLQTITGLNTKMSSCRPDLDGNGFLSVTEKQASQGYNPASPLKECSKVQDTVMANGLMLNNANLKGLNLWNSKMENSNLINAQLNGMYVEGGSVAFSKFNGAFMQFSRFDQTNMSGAEFNSGANLAASAFIGANMTGVDFSNSTLSNSLITFGNAGDEINFVAANANMTGIVLTNADLCGVKVSDPQSFAYYAGVASISLNGTKMSEDFFALLKHHNHPAAAAYANLAAAINGNPAAFTACPIAI